MLLKLQYLPRRLWSILKLSTADVNMEKCYFRRMEKEEKVAISFMYKVKDSPKQFNFSRKLEESIQTLFSRIETNLKKGINKAEKKKKNSQNNDTKMEINLYNCNNPVPITCTCEEILCLNGPLNLKIQESLFEVVVNPPWVLNIALPQCLLVGFTVSPDHFQTQYAKKNKCIYNWYKGSDINDKGNAVNEMHIKWEPVGSGFTYTPSAADVSYKLKLECIPSDGLTYGPAVEIVSKSCVEAGPGHCPFATRHLFTTTLLKNKSFRCVSYNILADLYCDSDFTRTELHPYCPPYALHIDYRKQLIMKELQGYNADIICLQEVDMKIFNHCLDPFLKENGFQGLFYKKGKDVAEGLACFYRSNRFKKIKNDSIILAEELPSNSCFKSIWDAIKGNKALADRILDLATVASATYLESIDNPKELLIIGNTHLYFHPDSDHIRLLQGGMVIYWLSALKKRLQNDFPDKRVSTILCGDFNSVPSCGVFQLYTTGNVPDSLPDWKSNLSQAVENLTLKQDMLMESACGTPEYTNYTSGFADCLDYIFYEKCNLDVEQVIPFPSVEELQMHTALPSIVFPSDHISIASDLRFI